MNITDEHRRRSLEIRCGGNPPLAKRPYQARIVEVRLEQTPDGRWITFIGKSKNGFPSTDVEISLWQLLQRGGQGGA